MEIKNLIRLATRKQFREWLMENSLSATECWVPVNKSNTPKENILWYLDAVEEALCFGWIDSTGKMIDGIKYQRFSPRRKGSNWTELNKERCRRLFKLGLMTESGLRVLPDLKEPFSIDEEVLEIFKSRAKAWKNFKKFPILYQKVRLDKVQDEKKHKRLESFKARLERLIDASEQGQMIGEWNDFGRLINY